VSKDASRVRDLGTGDGRLVVALLRIDRPETLGAGLDVLEPMLGEARTRFASDERAIWSAP
jgi:ubiquinone/menaquinone biosynthesis C-methylase UbiE